MDSNLSDKTIIKVDILNVTDHFGFIQNKK